MSRPLLHSCLLVGLLALSGCGGDSAESGTQNGGNPVEPAAEGPTTVKGRWLLRWTLPQRGFDFPIALIEVTDEGAETLEMGYLLEGATAEEVTAAEGRFHFRAKLDVGESFDVVAELKDGKALGNAVVPGRPEVYPMQFLSTKIKSLEEAGPAPTSGADEYVQTRRSGDSDLLREFVADRPSTPLAMSAVRELLFLSKRDGLSADELRSLVGLQKKLAARWGDRYVEYVQFDSALALAGMGHRPKVARQLLADLDDSVKKEWSEEIEKVGSRLDVVEAMLALEGDDEDARKKALATLRKAREDEPGDAVIMHTLAKSADDRGETEEALRLYAEIIVLPGVEAQLVNIWRQDGSDHPFPTKRFKELWKQAHPDAPDAEREALLDDVYRERSLYFVEGKEVPKADGNRVVLVELFTGEKCPPCVAADLAISGAEHVLERKDLIALRYHQHIPGTDPFANKSTETRFGLYAPGGGGTPTVAVGGKMVSPTMPIGPDAILGQSVGDADRCFDLLMGHVEPLLAESTDVTIDVSAVAKGRELTVTAKVAGLPDPIPETMRLHVVVAESDVPFVSNNGIRRQEMVVRWMLPTAEGTSPKDGKLVLESTFDLPELKQQIVDSLDDFENIVNQEIDVRPMAFENLVAVAFVQDEVEGDDKPILQATLAPVEGEPDFGK